MTCHLTCNEDSATCPKNGKTGILMIFKDLFRQLWPILRSIVCELMQKC
jgi:hypothetical protein